MNQNQSIAALDNTYLAHTYARFPLTLERGAGSLLYDSEGRSYIDMGTGIAVNTFGVADPVWQAAVTAQLSLLPHTSNLYYSAPAPRLAKLLCERTGMRRVFFSNSGAEANECAIKVARKYAADRYGTARHRIVTLTNSFHGRTVTTLAATGQEVFHHDFLPLTPGFVSAEPTLDAILPLLDDTCAAVMVECVQGEGGVEALDAAFLQGLAKAAAERDILLICDEVQCGNGRCGALYCYMNYGLTPDIVSTAKGLGGGLPIGATLLGEKVADTLVPGSHGSTFGGNPACCAGALSILERLDDATLAGVRERAAYIRQALDGAPGIRRVSGMGLMVGVLCDRPAGEVVDGCRARGVLVLRAKDRVRLLPALNIPMDLLKQATEVLKAVAAEKETEETV